MNGKFVLFISDDCMMQREGFETLSNQDVGCRCGNEDSAKKIFEESSEDVLAILVDTEDLHYGELVQDFRSRGFQGPVRGYCRSAVRDVVDFCRGNT